MVDGVLLAPPYDIVAIGDPHTMSTAMGIPGGVLDTLTAKGAHGTVITQDTVQVTALHQVATPQYARPAPRPPRLADRREPLAPEPTSEDPVIPDDLHYTAEHEWVKAVAGGVRVGITDHAQEALGDIVFVTLPAPGTQVVSGQTLGEVESTKSVSDIYAPVSGEVLARNEALDARPELVNADPTARAG